jgi:hypothetical protein
MDDLGAPLALGFSLFGHGALHLLWQIHLLYLDQTHLDPPGVGLLVQNFLQFNVQGFAAAQEIVKLDLP